MNGVFFANLLLFSEANSRKSRSFMGKLTKVDSLLVLLASEKRLRSVHQGVKEHVFKEQVFFITSIWIQMYYLTIKC